MNLIKDTRTEHKRKTPMIKPRISRNGNLTTYPLHHASPIYLRFPVKQPKERIGDFKFYPKSGKACGTVSACPNCGLKGQLVLMFKYDSCNDVRKRQCNTAHLRNLKNVRFVVSHRAINKVNGKHEYAGCCSFSFSFLEELDALLLHGRVIPRVVTRVFSEDKFGVGFNRMGKLIWSVE